MHCMLEVICSEELGAEKSRKTFTDSLQISPTDCNWWAPSFRYQLVMLNIPSRVLK